ncbi:MAG: glycosyltransferase family 39 protein [Dehalococcoidia bacterium]
MEHPPDTPPLPRRPWRAIEERLRAWGGVAAASRGEIALVAAITMLAAVLRLWRLGTVPLGLHGDEALTGIDALRVLREGWIGPYVESALGQPAGPLYVVAPLLKILPDTTWTLRFSMALFGIATIPASYAAFSTMFDRRTGVFAALLLAVMTWHLHLGRTGFMVTAWPLLQVLALWALFAAIQRRNVWLMGVAGVVTGVGIYTYNAYLLFLPVAGVALLWHYRSGGGRGQPGFAAGVVLFVCAAALVAVPMARYIDEHWEIYREHQRIVGVTDAPEWQEESWAGRADILADRTREWVRGLTVGGRSDFGDGLATQGHPVVDPITMLLAACGVLMALWRWRSPAHATLLAAAVILPLGAVLTTGDGLFRRTFGLAPIIAALGALPLSVWWESAMRRPERLRYASMAAMGLVLVYAGGRNIYDYFGPVQDTFEMRYVYPYEMDAASGYLAKVPRETVVYFYSDRWSVDYETRQYLAPDIGDRVDRSPEFRGVPFEITDEPTDYGIDRSRDAALVLMGAYLEDFDLIAERYPGGTLVEESRRGELLYRAYFLPASEGR